MIEYVEYLKNNLPVWLVFVILFVVGLLRFGPKFFSDYLDVSNKYRDRSDKITKEYITLLEKENKRLKEEIASEKSKK